LTRLTIMLGGPFTVPSSPPDISAILRRVSSHLGRELPEPVHVSISVQKNCIPTYGVGHLKRMEALRSALAREPWRGRMDVIGASVDGVSVGDCVENAKRAASRW
jgi:oxygen-dependent protoporphyrinogen oxidase